MAGAELDGVYGQGEDVYGGSGGGDCEWGEVEEEDELLAGFLLLVCLLGLFHAVFPVERLCRALCFSFLLSLMFQREHSSRFREFLCDPLPSQIGTDFTIQIIFCYVFFA